MKTFSDCKHSVAVSQGYESWFDMVTSERTTKEVVSLFADMAARMYAKELLKEVAKRAKIVYEKDERDDSIAFVDEESILNIIK